MESKIVGLIGTGQMGLPMGLNLVKSGYALNIFARRRESINTLIEKGAKYRNSPTEVFEVSPVVILALPGPPEVNQVIFGDGGLVQSQNLSGKIIIDTSTIDPESSRDMSRKLSALEVGYLDAPVSGGPEGASKATLTFMVGGEKGIFEKCRYLFESLGKNIFYVGPSGSGTGAKLVNQLLVASNTLASAEAMQLCLSLGLDSKQVIEIIKTSAGDSFAFRRVAPKIADRNFGPGWQTYLITKDLRLLLKTASELGLPAVSVKSSLEIFSQSVQSGQGDVDSSSVIKTLDALRSQNGKESSG